MKKIKLHNPENVFLTFIWSTIISVGILTLIFTFSDDCVLNEKTVEYKERVFKNEESEQKYDDNKKDYFASQAEIFAKSYSRSNNAAENNLASNIESFDSSQSDLFEFKVTQKIVGRQFGGTFTGASIVFAVLWVVAMGMALSSEIRFYHCPIAETKRENKKNAVLLEQEIIAKHRKMLESDNYNPLDLLLKSK